MLIYSQIWRLRIEACFLWSREGSWVLHRASGLGLICRTVPLMLMAAGAIDRRDSRRTVAFRARHILGRSRFNRGADLVCRSKVPSARRGSAVRVCVVSRSFALFRCAKVSLAHSPA